MAGVTFRRLANELCRQCGGVMLDIVGKPFTDDIPHMLCERCGSRWGRIEMGEVVPYERCRQWRRENGL